MDAGKPVTVLGTVMSTRLRHGQTVHQVEATGPEGQRLDLEVVARARHTGSVRVVWDPTGRHDPHFAAALPWRLIGLGAAIVIVIVVVGWLTMG